MEKYIICKFFGQWYQTLHLQKTAKVLKLTAIKMKSLQVTGLNHIYIHEQNVKGYGEIYGRSKREN